MVHARRLAAAGLALATLVGVAACSTETVRTGERPNKPTAAATQARTPNADPAAIRLSELPGYLPPRGTGEANVFERNMTDSAGTFSWSVVDEHGEPTGYSSREQVVFADDVADLDVPLDELRLGNALADIRQLDDALGHQRASMMSRSACPRRAGPGK